MPLQEKMTRAQMILAIGAQVDALPKMSFCLSRFSEKTKKNKILLGKVMLSKLSFWLSWPS